MNELYIYICFSKLLMMTQDSFERRHIGANDNDVEQMMETVGVGSINELIKETIPNSILKNEELKVEEAVSEDEYLTKLKKIALKNKNFNSF